MMGQTNKKGIYTFIFIIAALFQSSAYAVKSNPTSVASFETEISDFILVPFNGLVVISDQHKLYGYDTNTNQITWSQPIPKRSAKNIKQDFLKGVLEPEALFRFNEMTRGPDFNVIKDTPFLQKFFDHRLIIINSYNGNILFESDDSVFLFRSQYLIDEDALLLQGIENDKIVLLKYSIAENRYIWKTVIRDQFSNSFAKFVGQIEGQDADFITTVSLTKEKVFLLFGSKFYAFNRKSGSLLWKDEDGLFRRFIHNWDGSKVVLYNSPLKLRVANINFRGDARLEFRDGSSGAFLWDEQLEMERVYKLADWDDRFLVAYRKGFNFYDFSNGEAIFEKPIRIKDLRYILTLGNDLLAVFDNEMLLYDSKGVKKWRRSIEISDDDNDPILVLKKTSNNKIIFVTRTYANIVDYDSGKLAWKKYLKFDDDVPVFAQYDAASESVVIFNDRELFKFSSDDAERPDRFAKVKMKSEDSLRRIEVFGDVVAFTSNSELLGVNSKGKTVYHHRYRRAKNAGARWAKYGMRKLGAELEGLGDNLKLYPSELMPEVGLDVNTVTFLDYTQKMSQAHKVKLLTSAGHVVNSRSSRVSSDRYDQQKTANKYTIMVSQLKRRLGEISKVNRATGEVVSTIEVETSTPNFDYDSYTDNLYLQKGNQLQVFKGG